MHISSCSEPDRLQQEEEEEGIDRPNTPPAKGMAAATAVAAAASPERDWSKLPLDVPSLLFAKLGDVDVLIGAGLVCHSWLHAAKALPELWRSLDMERHHEAVSRKAWSSRALSAMAKVAVDRADGRLEVFAGQLFVTVELLNYILQRSPSLKRLRLISCCCCMSKSGFHETMTKSPLLELRSLELVKINVTNQELAEVLDNCPRLELLSLCKCFGIAIEDDEDGALLRAKCSRIKAFTVEWDSYSEFEEPLSTRNDCDLYYSSDEDWY